MDATLYQLVIALAAADQELRTLRARVAELEQDGQRQISEFADRIKSLEAKAT